MLWPLEQVPVERAIVAPLLLLRKLAAHEEELLSGVGPHEPVQRTEVREPLPAVPGHLREERALAVHDLVVREREDEVLRERVHEAERELVMVEPAIHRIALEVVQGVVHPAHVPLEAET